MSNDKEFVWDEQAVCDILNTHRSGLSIGAKNYYDIEDVRRWVDAYKKENIRILSFSEGTDKYGSSVHTLVTSRKIPKDKIPAIHEKLEAILNDDASNIVDYYRSFYTKELEDAFNAARFVTPDPMGVHQFLYVHNKFQDYIKSKQP